MIDYNETDENLDESDLAQYIEPSQLIMIQDNNWTPSEQFILGYANQLGFDLENDPPEMLDIAEKYLSVEIPDIYQRAFYKDSYKLVYINRLTNEIKLESDIEIQAKQEYQEVKEALTPLDIKVFANAELLTCFDIAEITADPVFRGEKRGQPVPAVQKIHCRPKPAAESGLVGHQPQAAGGKKGMKCIGTVDPGKTHHDGLLCKNVFLP